MKRKNSVFRVLILVTIMALVTSFAQAAEQKSVEITFYGGYQSFSGTAKGENVASDLYTGVWSPFFGQGYDVFNWMDLAGNLDLVVGNPILKQNAGALAGVKLGFNLNPAVQMELFFNYATTSLQFIDSAWSNYNEVVTDAFNGLELMGRSPEQLDESVNKSGKILQYGLNFNINLATQGNVIPYISFGGFAVSTLDAPYIKYDLIQYLGETSAEYTLELNYKAKTNFGAGGSFGLKFYFSDNVGLKAEVRGSYIPYSIDQQVKTTFTADSTDWTEFINYEKVSVTEKTNQIVVGGLIGLFFTF